MNINISNLIGEKSAVIANVNAREIPAGVKAAIVEAITAADKTGCKLDVHAQAFAGTVNLHITVAPLDIAVAPFDSKPELTATATN